MAVNEHGRRIGETHHNAHIPDAIVDQMRDRHEDDGLGYRKIAREFDVALTTVRKICTYERRAQTAERWKTIKGRKGKVAQIPVSRDVALIKGSGNKITFCSLVPAIKDGSPLQTRAALSSPCRESFEHA